ncbi:MAG: hypothetical protein ACR2PM_00390 [Hyphomicrobiales bacterium]
MENTLSTSEANRRFANALNLFVGRGRRFSVEAVAEATGIPRRTVQSYKDGEACPCHVNLLAMLAVLPAAFANEIFAPCGLEGVRRAEGGNPCTFAANESILTVAQRLGEMLANDGKFCHREQMEIAQKLFPKLVEDLQAWLNGHRSAADIVPIARREGAA